MRPVRILSVAPYEQLQELVRQAAKDFPEIVIDTFTGNLDTAEEYIRGLSLDSYDAIISRGGTAAKLRRIAPIAVVDVEVSVYDMLCVLLKAAATGKQFAVVGYENTISVAERLCRILNIEHPMICKVDQYTVGRCLEQGIRRGVELVVGDVIAMEKAEELGIPGMLLTSSAESIGKALTAALGYATAARHKTRENALYQAVAELSTDGIVILDQNRQIILCNAKAKALKLDRLMDGMESAIRMLETNMEYTFFRKVKGHTYVVRGHRFQYDLEIYYLFSIRKAGGYLANNGAIQFSGSEQTLDASFLVPDAWELRSSLERNGRMAGGRVPTVVWGSVGTEQDEAARYIYCSRGDQTKPLIRIHCPTLTRHQWQELTEPPQSLLNDSGYTVFLESIQGMSAQLQREVGQYLENTQLQKRHFLLASCVGDPDLLVMNGGLSLLLYENLCQMRIHMPDLDSRKNEFKSLAGYYIGKYSIRLDKRVEGMETEAVECLKHFHWEMNLIQWKKVLFQLVAQTSSSIITGEETRKALQRLQTGIRPVDSGYRLDMSKTMAEMQRDIICHVFQEENRNQSRTAKRLNISRTTVWRYTNENSHREDR